MRWKSFASPFWALYMHMGETTARLGSVRLRSLSGVNSRGVVVSPPDVGVVAVTVVPGWVMPPNLATPAQVRQMADAS
ncbi:hypothetical protein GCM10022625_02360 [Deinococcus aetherius]